MQRSLGRQAGVIGIGAVQKDRVARGLEHDVIVKLRERHCAIDLVLVHVDAAGRQVDLIF
ncbi:UNVERIFIED_CONTAM: hypothetical protein ACS92_05225 [Bacillus cereus]